MPPLPTGPSSKGKPAALATTAASLAPRVLQAPQAITANQALQASQVNLDSPVVHHQSACPRSHRSANHAHLVLQDPLDLRESQELLEPVANRATPAKTVAQAPLVHKVLQAHLVSPVRTDPQAMLGSLLSRPRPPPESPALRVPLDLKDHLDRTAAQELMASPVALDPRDPQAPMDSLATQAKTASQDRKDPQDRPERRVSARNIAPWTEVSSSRMECGDKQHFERIFLMFVPLFMVSPQKK